MLLSTEESNATAMGIDPSLATAANLRSSNDSHRHSHGPAYVANANHAFPPANMNKNSRRSPFDVQREDWVELEARMIYFLPSELEGAMSVVASLDYAGAEY